MSDRERLEKIVREAAQTWRAGGGKVAHNVEEAILDALVDANATLPPAPPPVLEVTEEAFRAFADKLEQGTSTDGLRAAWPHLTRSCADGLTDEECAAIADDVGIFVVPGLIRTILRCVAARREA